MTPEKRELMRKALEAADALDTPEYKALCEAAEKKAAMEEAAREAEAALTNADFDIPRGAPEPTVNTWVPHGDHDIFAVDSDPAHYTLPTDEDEFADPKPNGGLED